MIDRVERVIDTIRGGDGDRNIREAGIDLRKGHARLLSPKEVAVEGDVLRGEALILATGVRAFVPAIPGLREAGFITNVEAVTLPVLPRSLAIIGGGTIAMEFAQIFARFGVQVTVLGRNPRLLPLEEPELVEMLRGLLAQEGVRIETGVTLERVSSTGDRKRIVAHRARARFEIETDEILVAAGRTPQVEDLGLETAGVVHDATGIIADAVAAYERAGSLGRRRLCGWLATVHLVGRSPGPGRGTQRARRSSGAGCARDGRPDGGLHRPGAGPGGAHRSSGAARRSRRSRRDGPDARPGAAVITGETAGAVKLVADAATGRMLGGSVLAAGGGELLGEIALAVRLGLTCHAIADTLHAYPTFSEGVFWTPGSWPSPRTPATRRRAASRLHAATWTRLTG